MHRVVRIQRTATGPASGGPQRGASRVACDPEYENTNRKAPKGARAQNLDHSLISLKVVCWMLRGSRAACVHLSVTVMRETSPMAGCLRRSTCRFPGIPTARNAILPFRACHTTRWMARPLCCGGGLLGPCVGWWVTSTWTDRAACVAMKQAPRHQWAEGNAASPPVDAGVSKPCLERQRGSVLCSCRPGDPERSSPRLRQVVAARLPPPEGRGCAPV